ncbi:MAG: triose-phosphate isomerase [Planctomycetota bacterium]|jgi:triosephosphate isomerase
MQPLIAGNWKMHKSRAEASTLAEEIVRGLPSPLDGVEVALFPPFLSLRGVVSAVADTDILVGAQNFYPEDKGAFTGEIAPPMLLDAGATCVLCGHSERRHILGEDDAFINRKVLAALGHDILPILCVGETLEEREAGQMEAVIERQLSVGLEGVTPDRAANLTVAYEPVWAIGTGLTATTEQAGEVHARIRQLLNERWGAAGAQVRILYGGSVKPDNARELLGTPEIGGVLVGGASLQAESFIRIAKAALPA